MISSYMGYTDDITDSNVEERVIGEFMHRVQDSPDISFELAELLEEQSYKNDLGGSDELIGKIESELIDNAD
jgi:hypothetical protein